LDHILIAGYFCPFFFKDQVIGHPWHKVICIAALALCEMAIVTQNHAVDPPSPIQSGCGGHPVSRNPIRPGLIGKSHLPELAPRPLLAQNSAPAYSLAKDLEQGQSDAPLHIEAQDSVSCPSPGHVWLARGKVTLKKGDLIVKADCIHVEFQPSHVSKKRSFQRPGALLLPMISSRVRSISAVGNVVVQHPSGTLHSHQAKYTFASETIHASGPCIRLKTPKWTLFSDKSLVYSHATRTAHALGRARLVGDEKGLESQELHAQFGLNNLGAAWEKLPLMNPKKSRDQALELQWARSDCPIRIWNKEKKYVATADKAELYGPHQKICFQGHVRIRYKTEYIEGDRASINLKNGNISISGVAKMDPHLSGIANGAVSDSPGGVDALISTTSFSPDKKASK
jgi:lipopolysaccharide export system protein LptA